MAETGTFLVKSDEWLALEMGGAVLTPGDYIIENVSTIYVGLVISTAMPSLSDTKGHAFIMDRRYDSHSTVEFKLVGMDVVYARSRNEDVTITILQT